MQCGPQAGQRAEHAYRGLKQVLLDTGTCTPPKDNKLGMQLPDGHANLTVEKQDWVQELEVQW